jgi:hypothetical protein
VLAVIASATSASRTKSQRNGIQLIAFALFLKKIESLAELTHYINTDLILHGMLQDRRLAVNNLHHETKQIKIN